MKAVRLGMTASLDALDLVEVKEPGPPGPLEISVRVRASSLNYHDYAVITGIIPTAAGRIPMSDGAGEVTEIGRDVTDFKVGDLVVSTFFPNWLDGAPAPSSTRGVPGDGSDGFACEMVTAPARNFTHAPTGYSAAEAATLTCAGLTAWRAIAVNGKVKAGDVVLVQGTGGVSIFALQFAKAMGATVIATSSSEEKLARLAALGADHTINYRAEPKWGAAARAFTGGRGVDHIVEVGGSGTLPQSLAAIALGGHIALVGVLTGRVGEIPTALVVRQQTRLEGLAVGSRRHQLDMVRAIEAIGLRPVIDKTFSLGALADAFRYQESGAHFGKIGVLI